MSVPPRWCSEWPRRCPGSSLMVPLTLALTFACQQPPSPPAALLPRAGFLSHSPQARSPGGKGGRRTPHHGSILPAPSALPAADPSSASSCLEGSRAQPPIPLPATSPVLVLPSPPTQLTRPPAGLSPPGFPPVLPLVSFASYTDFTSSAGPG